MKPPTPPDRLRECGQDRPVIFSGPMIQALLAGRKMQTRRLIKDDVRDPPGMDAIHPKHTAIHPAPYLDSYCGGRRTKTNPRGMSDRWCWWTRDDRQRLPTFRVPFVPGNHLWVREAWTHDAESTEALRAAVEDVYCDHSYGPYYRATEPAPETMRWRSPIFMPRWASRLTLIVTDVRVERLQDISESDAIAEGMPDFGAFCEALDPGKLNAAGETAAQTATRLRWLQRWYSSLWDELHGDGAWEANPWIVAVSFRVIRANIDALPTASTEALPGSTEVSNPLPPVGAGRGA